jgi:predicted dehydrogenase
MSHRRAFLKGLAGTALATAASSRRVAGANNRVRVGFIGIGLIGKRHLLDFQAQADCEIAAICEVSEERRDDGVAAAGNGPVPFDDFRRMLDRPDIDAVVVSTPDHWHALMTIMACAAGKDVYVEKPLTHALREGEWMLDAARRNGRVVQVGTQQRAGAHYLRARRLLREGHIGEIRGARVSTARNILPGFTVPVGKPLSHAQWDMWLGPAPAVPYEPTRGLYHFRWFWDYSGGQTTNLLAHEVDIVQWVTGQVPRRVAAFAQRRSLTGIGETPDVFEGIFEYPGFLLNWSSREVAAGGRGGLEMYGTKGMLTINRRGFEILPDPMLTPESQIPRFTGPVVEPATPAPRCEAIKDVGYEQVRDQFRPHVRNFLDCVKSRQAPLADLEGAHQTSIACHLANIAMRTGRVIQWDPARNDIVGDAAASALLTKTYRAPWDQQLRSAMGSA